MAWRGGDGFEIETLIHIRVAEAGLAVKEVPSFEHSRVYGASNLRAFRDSTPGAADHPGGKPRCPPPGGHRLRGERRPGAARRGRYGRSRRGRYGRCSETQPAKPAPVGHRPVADPGTAAYPAASAGLLGS